MGSIGGGASSSKSSGSTGQVGSLSFIPSLLANAFFGTGIGLNDEAFTSTGLNNFGGSGKAKGGISSLIDPFGLGEVVSSNPFLGPNNPFSTFDSSAGGFAGTGQFGGSSGGGFWTPQGFVSGSGGFAQGLQGGSNSGFLGGLPTPQGSAGTEFNLPGKNKAFTENPAFSSDIFLKNKFFSENPAFAKLLGLKDPVSPQDQALQRTKGLLDFSPTALGLGQGGSLNPNDLISNIMDLLDPAINPGIGGGLQGLQLGQIGQQLSSDLLFGDVRDTLSEGLQTGLKPDLQPVIDEATRSFFQDIVPQLGQQNVALQEGVGPFSTDLSGQLLQSGSDLQSQLGSLEVQNQNQAADRRLAFEGLAPTITSLIANLPLQTGQGLINLGEQLALQGTTGGRQATVLQLLSGLQPSGPIQSSSQQSSASQAQGNLGVGK